MQLPNKHGKNHPLRTERLQRQWSQRELAERVGATVSTVKRWERQATIPGPYFRLKLTALFGKSEEALGLGDVISLPVIPPKREISEEVQTSSSPTNLSKLWTVPYQRNLYFTGRDPVLEHLHTVLTRQSTRAALTQSYAVHGLGGIGKTQLAIEYAYQHRSDYNAILWVEAETQTTLISSFITLAALLTLPEKTEGDQTKIVAEVLRWLNGHEGWLLIFDNVEDLSLLKPFLPASDQGALLLTTRLQSLGTLAQRVELPPMTMQEGCAFLLARTNRLRQDEEDASIDPQEMAVAQQIVSEMGGLPLALEQAGAYIDATRCGLSDYFHLFQTVPQHLLDIHEPSSDHPLSVCQTFALALEQVEQQNTFATELLTACAFLAPDAIPETFFLEGTVSLGSPFEVLAADPFVFHDAIKTLLTYSLIQRNIETKTVTIHRLVQAVLKERLPVEVQHTWIVRVLRTVTHIFPSDENIQADYWQVGDPLLPHALTCITLGEQWQDEVLRFTLMNHVAIYLSNRLRFSEAEALFQRVLGMAEQTPGFEHSLVTEVLCGLGLLSIRQKKLEEATLLLQRALLIQERIPGSECPLKARVLNGLGTLYEVQGKYTEAEQFHERALCIRELTLGSEHPLVATSLNNLAGLYTGQGKYTRAKQFYGRALQIREQTLGSEHPLMAASLNNLAHLYTEQGEYTKAEPLFQQALRIWEHVLGSEHIRLSYPLTGLADLYTSQGKYEKAEPLFLRALRIIEQRQGPEHFHTADVFDNLADLYTQQHRCEEAESLYQRALRIRKQQFGPEHPLIARSLTGLAVLLSKQGYHKQAEPLYQQALAIRQQHLSPQHPDVAETLFHFARFHQIQQHTTEALSLYQQALAIQEQALGPDHPKTRKTRTNSTQLLEEVKKEEEAERVPISSSMRKRASEVSNDAEVSVEKSREEHPPCPTCLRTDGVVRSGINRPGSRRFRCCSCQRYFTPHAHQRGYDPSLKSQALAQAQKGMSARAIAQQLKVHHSTVSLWIKEDQKQQEDQRRRGAM